VILPLYHRRRRARLASPHSRTLRSSYLDCNGDLGIPSSLQTVSVRPNSDLLILYIIVPSPVEVDFIVHNHVRQESTFAACPCAACYDTALYSARYDPLCFPEMFLDVFASEHSVATFYQRCSAVRVSTTTSKIAIQIWNIVSYTSWEPCASSLY
jgi:hypothetical protein